MAARRQLDPLLAEGGLPASSWSATARRWAWRRCTPGCRTPTARRPRWSRRCSPGRCSTAPSSAILRVHAVMGAAGLAEFSGRAAGALRAALDGGGGRVHHRPGRLQADAGLLQRRAHGHPGAGRRAGRRWPASARCCTRSTTRSTKAMLFLAGRQHPGGLPHQGRRRRCAACCRPLPVTGVLWVAGFLAITGLAAVRAVRQRVDDPQGRAASRGRRLVAVGYLAAAGRRSSSAWRRIVLRDGARAAPPASRSIPTAAASACGRSCRPLALGAVVLALGLCLPPTGCSSAPTAAAAAGGAR